MIRKLFRIGAIFLITISAYGASKEVEIPRTSYKNLYKFYVVEESKKNTNFVLSYKRLGYDTILFGKVEVNCPSKVIRSLGTSIKSVKDINTENPTQWVKPTIGTIESDMISYLCR
jgi:hypothetical protein